MKRRRLRKLLSMILAVVMVFGMNAMVFAADSTNYTITINNTTSEYIYIAYQIFVGDLSTNSNGDSVLSNVEFGSALSAANQAAVLSNYENLEILNYDINGDGTIDYESSAAGLAQALADGKIGAADFASYIADNYTLTSAGTSSYNSSNYTISVTGAGYYLVKNTAVSSGTGSAYSNYILEVVGNVSVDPKSDVPELTKLIGDINDSEATATTASGSDADHDIGDSVPFELTATLPDNYADYTTYTLTFHDTMSSGLSFNNDVSVYVVDNTSTPGVSTKVSSGYSVNTSGQNVTVTITDTNALQDSGGNSITVTSTSTIVVIYTATLESGAGNIEKNEAYLEYSNNPNSDSTGKTPKEQTYVFNYKLTVNKKNSKGESLEGAGFTLYKYDADTQDYVVVKEITGVTSFTWNGLDDGQYKLSETKTPNGYNTMEDIEFKIVATHEDGDGTITSLKITGLDNKELTDFTVSKSGSTFTGEISTDITNYTGAELPSTGGIGTTIFYVVGGILVIGAAILLVTKKRLGKME